jgi:hypothetical protein
MVMAAAKEAGEVLGIVSPDKAKLVIVENFPDSEPYELEFMFNPTEYSLTQPVTVSQSRTAATPGGTMQYGGAGPMTLNLTMFLDDFASARGDVTPKVSTLLEWTKPTAWSLLPPIKPEAPILRFVWGGNPQLATFKGFLSNVNATYLLFRKDGRPVQAKVVITIQGQQERADGTNPTSRATSNSRRTRTTIAGDTLQSIAFGELGKATYWRAIAELNGIDDPLRVGPGVTLLIPSLADAARGS